jgi:hypothetical protein
MRFARLWNSLLGKSSIQSRKASPSAKRRPLILETLEDRFAPAVLTVNTNADNNSRDAVLSFREAILVNTGALAVANLTPQEQAQIAGQLGNDTVGFAQAAFNAAPTITLASALPDLAANVTVQGTGANALTVSRNGNAAAFRVFNVAANANVTINGLTISGGNAAAGGGIQNAGTLTLGGVVLSNNTAVTGAGLTNLAGATANITGTTIHANNATDWAGGINNQGVMTLVNSTVSSNTAVNSPAGINNAGSLSLTNVTVSANRSSPGTAAPGNGIWQSDARGTLTMRNTIVAGNFGPGGAADDLRGPVVGTSDFNIIGSAANLAGITNGTNNNRIGTAAAPLDAGIGILLANGGGTPTHALLQGSIAINAGTNGGIVPVQDQRSIARVAAVDIGAYEYTGFQPTWLEQGPSLIDTRNTINGNGMVKVANGQAVGAVNTVAVHPTNPDILYVASVNGGVWKTINGTSATPTWTPLTDAMPSLATSDIAFSPLDNTGNTLFVGTGSTSSLAGDGGRPVGIYRTTDGGATWTQLGQTIFGADRNLRIGNIVPTALTTGNAQVLLASTSDGQPAVGQDGGTTGLYRSPDGGTTWVRISGTGNLPDAPISHLISNAAGNRFFAAVPGFGVYTSTDGLAWTRLGLNVGAATRVRLTLQGNNVLYAAMLGAIAGENGTRLIGLSRTADQGASWVALNVPSDATGPLFGGGQGDSHFSMVVDPNDPTVLYIAGDVQRNFNQAGGWVARTFRGVFSQANPNQTAWTLIVSGDANALGAPHADSRSMVFDGNGNLLQANDGGIYRLLTPNAANRRWISISGNLRITEFHAIAFDPLNNVIIGGAQDNGTPQQDNGNLAYNDPARFNWSDTLGGDGGIPRVDTQTTPGQSVRFYSSQNFGGFTRRFYDAANTSLQVGNPGLGGIAGAFQFYQPYAVNAVNPSRIVLGTREAAGSLLESTDQGETFTALAGTGTGAVGTAVAFAYGGRLNGQAAEGVLYASTDLVDANGRGTILFRQTIGGAINRLANYPGNRPVDMVVDPDNWRRLYVLDVEGRIWRSTDAGGSFTNVTGNLVLGQGTAGGIDIYAGTTAANDEVIFVGGANGVFASSNAWGANGYQWSRFGTGLPNVPVRDIEYNASRNVLAVGTLGRGAWLIPQVSDAVGTPAPVLDLNGAAAGIDFAATWNPGGGAVAIVDPTLTLADGAGRLITSAQVFLTNFRDANVESLAANTAGTKIVASYNPTTRILSLIGADTAANYQQVLRTITYNNTAANPTAAARIVTFQVTNDFVSSFLARSTITVNGANVGPQVDLNGGGGGQDNRVAAAENGAPVPIAPVTTLTDGQSATIASATVTLSTRTNGIKESLTANTAGTSITAQYDPNTGALTLTGPDSTANFEQVLRSVTYQNTADDMPTEIRYATVVVNDGTLNSPTYRVEIDLQGINDAPVLDNSNTFAIRDSEEDNEGTDLVDLLISAGIALPITDPDGSTNRSGEFGIAIVGVDNSNGQWQFKIEGGGEEGESEEDAEWENIEDVSDANAILLAIREEIRIRFVPKPGFLGVVTNGLQFRAWDMSTGDPAFFPDAEGGRSDASVNGGTSAFSTAVGNVNVKVVDTTMSYKQDKIVTPLAQGATYTVDSAGNRAWFLDKELNLMFAGSYYTNFFGRGEKWLRGNLNNAVNPWYFILPNGEFYSWNGTNKAEGTLITKLPPLFYLQPQLVWNPSREHLAVLIDQIYGLDYTNANFDLNYGGAGEKWARGTGGQWFFMYPNGKLFAWDGMLQQATGTLIAELPSAYYSDFVNRVVTPAANQITASIDNANNLVIDPANGYLGDIYVNLTTTPNNNAPPTDTLSFIEVKNFAPTATPVPFQSMPTAQNNLSVPLDGTDADTGDTVSYSAIAGNAGYVLGQRYGLNRDPFGGYFQNSYGGNEKWFRGINRDWFFIKPTGEFYEWDGEATLATSERIAVIDPIFWDRPELMTNGQPQDLARSVDQALGLSFVVSLYQNYGGQNEKWVFGSADASWYFIKPDGSLWRWDGQLNKATGKRVAEFDEAYWTDPTRLYNAPANQIAAPTITGGNTLVLDPAANFIGELWILLRTTDGKDTVSNWFTLDVTAN